VTKAYCLNKLGDDYSGGLVKYFIEAFEGLGGECVHEEFPDGNSDFTSYVANAKNADCGVFFSPVSTEAAQLIIDQVVAQGASFPLLAGDTWDSNVILQAAKGKDVQVTVTTFYPEGADASFDAILSASVLLSAIVFLLCGLSLEAWVGVVIAGFIIKSGFEMITDTLDDILGKRAEAELTGKIRRAVLEEAAIRGVYDIIVNDYGPNKNTCSLHIELPDFMTVDQVDVITRQIQSRVLDAAGVIVTGVSVYSYNTKDDEAAAIRGRVTGIVLSHDWALQLHGFYADTVNKTLRFDVVMSFDITVSEALSTLYSELSSALPGYTVHITPDVDAAD
jgi:hypothetical protein